MTRLPHPLISATELRRRLDSGEPLVVLDTRWALGQPSQRSAYESEHIPGAAWVEFEEALTGTPGTGGRHPMPSAETFESAMRAAGVCNNSNVVVYDDNNSLAAARCWWLLRYFGHDCVQVLDGGLAAWLEINGPTEPSCTGNRGDDGDLEPNGDFVATPGSLHLLNADEAAELADECVLIDARPANRFEGRDESIDPVAGHIPGAISIPALSNLDENGHFLPSDDLALRFSAAGLVGQERIGTYCGSGVQAMHLALALDVSGRQGDVAVYVGSWSDYITDPDRPIATGPQSSSQLSRS